MTWSNEDTQEYMMPWLTDDSDEIPEYDHDDPGGDRREFLDDPAHLDVGEIFPDEAP